MNAPLLPVLLLPLLLLAGCASEGDESWPTLARRAGERSTGGPVCPGCTSASPVATPAPATPAPLPLPAGVDAELAAIDRDLAAVEKALPARGEALAKAQAAARGKDDADDATVEAEVQRTRFDALLAPLGEWEDQLETLAGRIAGTQGAEAVTPRITALQDRIAALRTVAGGMR